MASPSLSRERPPVQTGGIRRTFTQPPRSLSFHEKAGLDPSDSAADVLYSHSRARIVSFTPPTDAVRSASSPSSTDLDYPIDAIETLPWASSTEELLASGSLIIEKIRGSTNFLKSGTRPLHALMRNSQCWCVDGESTLVMRVGAFKYYRIELPYTSEDDKADVQRLKDVLKQILRFEATPCPFKRGFHVDLPESATTPRKKSPWKRKPGSSVTSPSSASLFPLSLKKVRAQVAPTGRGTLCEAQSPNAGVNAADRDNFSHVGCYEHGEHDVLPDIAIEDDGADTRHSDLRNGHVADCSTNLISTADTSKDRPLEIDDCPGGELDTTGDQLVPDEPVIEHDHLEVSDGEADGQVKRGTEFDQLGGQPDASSTPAHSTDGIGSVHEGLNSIALPDGQSSITPDSCPQTIRPVNVPDGLSRKEHVIPKCIEQPTAETTAEITDPPEALTENSQKVATSNYVGAGGVDEGGEAEGPGAIEEDDEAPILEGTDEADESALRLEAQEFEGSDVSEQAEEAVSNVQAWPDNLTEPAQHRPESPAYSPDAAPKDSVPSECCTVEVVDVRDSQRILSEPDSPSSDAVSVSSLADSFHSVVSSEGRSSVVEPTGAECSSPTPLAELDDPLGPPYPHHKRDTSEKTIIAGSTPSLQTDLPIRSQLPFNGTSEGPSTPSLLRSSASDSSWPDVETPVNIAIEKDLRRRMRMKRSFSPQPPASTVFTSSPQSPRGSHLTGAILQKACNLALGKPIEVVVMLVHILARIAGGATVNDLMNGDLFRQPPEPASEHRRNHSRPGHAEYRSGDVSEEDDYGVPVRCRVRSAAPKDDDTDSLFELD